ncbi:MAG: phosphotransferase family protein [Dermatophilaceae bacterium]
MDAERADLLGPLGENAVFGLPGGIVARVSAGNAAERAAREVRVARWLESVPFPAIRVLPAIPVPVEAAGCVLTFWVRVREISQAAPSELGNFLRRLHLIPTPPPGVTEPFDPFAGIAEHIESAVGLPSEEQNFLSAILEKARRDFEGVNFGGGPCVIHGDAHRKNIVREKSGNVLMLDLERACVGPQEWDLIVAAVYHRVGWYTAQDYTEFANAYGRDITMWAGFETVATIRQLRMIAWLAARTGREPRLIPEVRARLKSLPEGGGVRHYWRPGV